MPWLQIATGLVLLAIAWHMGKLPITLLRGGAATAGTIVRFEEVASTSTTRLRYSAFHPVVEFAVDGRRVQVMDRWGSSSAAGLNATVPVLFAPGEPSLALVDRGLRNWLPWAPTGLVGAFLLLVGVAAKVRERRR